MRFVIHPAAEPDHEVDVTKRLVGAIARELWLRYGGNETLNWIEAERHLQGIVEDARKQAEDMTLAENAA
ncbi:MAG: hypothetical protein L0Y44_03885 [Phycisphaerales bacterium]|nr:hypothetical protein [Phycisphaerales bacterium]MCI0629777.1 hypothetical protein [Phycisphaerales bacterium]MCI0676512.1 hypothetical protein [Phycisphaerales bacterium]